MRASTSHAAANGFRVSGKVSATVRQACVVTLEPVVNQVTAPFEVDFAPVRDVNLNESNEMELDVEAADEPEPLLGNSIDLGAIATEFLILGVDPYPRRPDVAFEAPSGEADATGSPFAALAALKKSPTSKE
jgi:hypothetical protein